ncbi:MAG: hypothetical protein ACRDF5_07175 [bacterium]
MQGEDEVRNALDTLVRDAVQRILETGGKLDEYAKGTAFFDPQRDERFTSLPSFGAAVASLDSLPAVQAQFGSGNGPRLALQFIYSFLGGLGLGNLAFDPGGFETTFASLLKELSTPEWVHVGVSNLQNFRTETEILDLGDGVVIQGRSRERLAEALGWSDQEFAWLLQDWEQGAFGSHVLLVQHKQPKSPDNFILADASSLRTKAQRALLALRLFKQGDVRTGRMFVSRSAAFNVGFGGMAFTGFTVWHPGNEYHLGPSEVPAVRVLYEALIRLERRGEQGPRNVSLALRSFSSVYERYGHQAEDRVVDAITAIEALLGVTDELSFRLAFRVAGILANDEDERVAMFADMKSYYDTRSRIVHGEVLRERDLALTSEDEPLRGIVRRLLVGFLHLVQSPTHTIGRSFYEQLDGVLQHATRRDELRRAMDLSPQI